MEMDEISTGMDHAPAEFDLRTRLLGENRSHFDFIKKKTDVTVTLRSELYGPNTANPMHVCVKHDSDAASLAVELVVNLITAVQQQFVKMYGKWFAHPKKPRITRSREIKFSPPKTPDSTLMQGLKICTGLETAPKEFDLRNNLLGENCSHMTHIMNESGADVKLLGMESIFCDNEGMIDESSDEPLHFEIKCSSRDELDKARHLVMDLIQTLRSHFLETHSLDAECAGLPPIRVLPLGEKFDFIDPIILDESDNLKKSNKKKKTRKSRSKISFSIKKSEASQMQLKEKPTKMKTTSTNFSNSSGYVDTQKIQLEGNSSNNIFELSSEDELETNETIDITSSPESSNRDSEAFFSSSWGNAENFQNPSNSTEDNIVNRNSYEENAPVNTSYAVYAGLFGGNTALFPNANLQIVQDAMGQFVFSVGGVPAYASNQSPFGQTMISVQTAQGLMYLPMTQPTANIPATYNTQDAVPQPITGTTSTQASDTLQNGLLKQDDIDRHHVPSSTQNGARKTERSKYRVECSSERERSRRKSIRKMSPVPHKHQSSRNRSPSHSHTRFHSHSRHKSTGIRDRRSRSRDSQKRDRKARSRSSHDRHKRSRDDRSRSSHKRSRNDRSRSSYDHYKRCRNDRSRSSHDRHNHSRDDRNRSSNKRSRNDRSHSSLDRHKRTRDDRNRSSKVRDRRTGEDGRRSSHDRHKRSRDGRSRSSYDHYKRSRNDRSRSSHDRHKRSRDNLNRSSHKRSGDDRSRSSLDRHKRTRDDRNRSSHDRRKHSRDDRSRSLQDHHKRSRDDRSRSHDNQTRTRHVESSSKSRNSHSRILPIHSIDTGNRSPISRNLPTPVSSNHHCEHEVKIESTLQERTTKSTHDEKPKSSIEHCSESGSKKYSIYDPSSDSDNDDNVKMDQSSSTKLRNNLMKDVKPIANPPKPSVMGGKNATYSATAPDGDGGVASKIISNKLSFSIKAAPESNANKNKVSAQKPDFAFASPWNSKTGKNKIGERKPTFNIETAPVSNEIKNKTSEQKPAYTVAAQINKMAASNKKGGDFQWTFSSKKGSGGLDPSNLKNNKTGATTNNKPQPIKKQQPNVSSSFNVTPNKNSVSSMVTPYGSNMVQSSNTKSTVDQIKASKTSYSYPYPGTNYGAYNMAGMAWYHYDPSTICGYEFWPYNYNYMIHNSYHNYANQQNTGPYSTNINHPSVARVSMPNANNKATEKTSTSQCKSSGKVTTVSTPSQSGNKPPVRSNPDIANQPLPPGLGSLEGSY